MTIIIVTPISPTIPKDQGQESRNGTITYPDSNILATAIVTPQSAVYSLSIATAELITLKSQG